MPNNQDQEELQNRHKAWGQVMWLDPWLKSQKYGYRKYGIRNELRPVHSMPVWNSARRKSSRCEQFSQYRMNIIRFQRWVYTTRINVLFVSSHPEIKALIDNMLPYSLKINRIVSKNNFVAYKCIVFVGRRVTQYAELVKVGFCGTVYQKHCQEIMEKTKTIESRVKQRNYSYRSGRKAAEKCQKQCI